MKKLLFLTAIAALSAPAVDAKRTPHVWPELGVETSITFPQYGGIDNFEADGDRGIWIEDQRSRWYYGTFFGPCIGLNFVNAIGYKTNGIASQFDRHSSIIVDGWDCRLSSLVTAEKPLPRKERTKLRKAKQARVQ